MPVTVGLKRRQEEERGMGNTPTISSSQVLMVSPEPVSRTTSPNRLNGVDLPGSWAHIETSRKAVEQERPVGPPKEGGTPVQERIKARVCERVTGVGPTHSSAEAVEVGESRRGGGAKGWARQGTRGKDR